MKQLTHVYYSLPPKDCAVYESFGPGDLKDNCVHDGESILKFVSN